MKAKGKNLIVVGSILVLLGGLASLAMVLGILSADLAPFSATITSTSGTMVWSLILIYATIAVQIIAGIVGLMFASKPEKYKVCYVVGMILILITAKDFLIGFTMEKILAYVIAMVGPICYFLGAAQNKESL